MDFERIFSILQQNEGKPFVKRILRPDRYPSLDLGDGNRATHLMSWADDGKGNYYVYPTVVEGKGGNLEQLAPDAAQRRAKETGDFIHFDNEKDADEFSKQYKRYWTAMEAVGALPRLDSGTPSQEKKPHRVGQSSRFLKEGYPQDVLLIDQIRERLGKQLAGASVDQFAEALESDPRAQEADIRIRLENQDALREVEAGNMTLEDYRQLVEETEDRQWRLYRQLRGDRE